MRFLIIILLFLSFSSKASDSLKIKSKRFLIELNYGEGDFAYNQPIEDKYYGDFGSTGQDVYSFSKTIGGQVNFNYLIFDRKKRKIFGTKLFIGLGINLNQMYVRHEIGNYSEHLKPGYDNHDFSKNNFAYTVTPLNFSWNLNWIILIKKFIVYQKLGAYYSTYVQKKEIPYQEHVYGWTSTVNPPYVTNSYDYNVDLTEKNYFKNCFNNYYSLGLGYRIKSFTPLLSVEIATFNNNYWSPLVKTQLGLMMEF